MTGLFDYLYSNIAILGAIVVIVCVLATVFASTFLLNEDHHHAPRPRLRRETLSKVTKRIKRSK